MAEANQPVLNGAYYGPSVPPPKSYHRPSRSSGCCSLKFLLKLIITAIVIIGLAVLIFWFIFRPKMVKFHITDVTLTEFNLTTGTNTLNYNLAVNMTIRNPNKRIGIYYDRIKARAYYEDQRFDAVQLTPFYQGHKSTSYLNPVFKGEKVLVSLGDSGVSTYNSEKTSGIYNIDLKLYLRIRFKLGKLQTHKFKPKIKCDLKVPLDSNGVSTGSFQTTKCDIDQKSISHLVYIVG